MTDRAIGYFLLFLGLNVATGQDIKDSSAVNLVSSSRSRPGPLSSGLDVVLPLEKSVLPKVPSSFTSGRSSGVVTSELQPPPAKQIPVSNDVSQPKANEMVNAGLEIPSDANRIVKSDTMGATLSKATNEMLSSGIATSSAASVESSSVTAAATNTESSTGSPTTTVADSSRMLSSTNAIESSGVGSSSTSVASALPSSTASTSTSTVATSSSSEASSLASTDSISTTSSTSKSTSSSSTVEASSATAPSTSSVETVTASSTTSTGEISTGSQSTALETATVITAGSSRNNINSSSNSQSCVPQTCDNECSLGYQTDQDGCPTCRCRVHRCQTGIYVTGQTAVLCNVATGVCPAGQVCERTWSGSPTEGACCPSTFSEDCPRSGSRLLCLVQQNSQCKTDSDCLVGRICCPSTCGNACRRASRRRSRLLSIVPNLLSGL